MEDLIKCRADGEDIDLRDITKHRNDVFRLAGTLPEQPGPLDDRFLPREGRCNQEPGN